MPIIDLFSNRDANSQSVDVWAYDSVPEKLKVQVSNIVRDALGSTEKYVSGNSAKVYTYIRENIAHEHGVRELVSYSHSDAGQVLTYIQVGKQIDIWLDLVELSFRIIERSRGKFDEYQREAAKIKIPADEAISELNERFRRAGFGYRYAEGAIFRIDSELLHQEVTLPALRFLADPRFTGANDEFLAAHAHYKAGEFRDCAVDANNALESTMKAICDAKGWTYSKGATAGDLLNVLRNNNLIPGYVSGSFQQLINTLSSGLPAVRNNTGGHGQGAELLEVPEYVAAYALHLAGSKIRFLYEAFRASEAG